MAFTFNPVTRQILIPQSEAQPLNVITFRDTVRDYEYSEEGVQYGPIIAAEGLTNLGNASSTFLTVELQRNWQVAFTGTGLVTVSGGNLVGGIGGNPFAFTAGIQVVNLLSQAGVAVETGVSGLTTTEAFQLSKLASIEPNTNLIPYLVATQ